jgi:signal transduction histidine kinase
MREPADPPGIEAEGGPVSETAAVAEQAGEPAGSAPVELASRWAMEAVGEVAGSIAREIGSPLTAIEIAVDLIRRQDRRPEKNELLEIAGRERAEPGGPEADGDRDGTEAQLRIILAQSHRLASLARTLLAIAHPVSPRSRPVEVNEIVRQVGTTMTSDMEARNIRLSLDLSRDLPAARGDPNQLRGALVALLTNAGLALEQWAGPREILLSTARRDDGTVAIRVRDTGPGVEEGHRERVFLPFFSGWGRQGMGLHLSRRALLSQGGELELEDHGADEGGATFTLVLEVESGPERTREAGSE